MTVHAWALPDQISDVLPLQASLLEQLRRQILDMFQQYGYELVIPPLVEYADSLFDDQDQELNGRTVQWTDGSSGRAIAIRPDMTSQTARIDAHILNHQLTTRLCYAGSVFHSQARGLLASREPLVVGAEIYGVKNLNADLEILRLVLASLKLCKLPTIRIDVAHAKVVRTLLQQIPDLSKFNQSQIFQALSSKNVAQLQALSDGIPAEIATALIDLTSLYGGADIIQKARQCLPQFPDIQEALNELEAISTLNHEGIIQFDLADVLGYNYHTGVTFNAYCHGVPNAIVRGGRYDEYGKKFGRPRPATGFSMDLREIVEVLPVPETISVMGAPWNNQPQLLSLIDEQRRLGHVVIQLDETSYAQQKIESERFVLTQIFREENGQWQLVDLK